MPTHHPTSYDHTSCLTSAAAMAALSISERSLRTYIATGRLPAHKHRGRIHVAPTDLAAFDAPEPAGPQSDLDPAVAAWAARVAADAPPIPAHAAAGIAAILIGGATG